MVGRILACTDVATMETRSTLASKLLRITFLVALLQAPTAASTKDATHLMTEHLVSVSFGADVSVASSDDGDKKWGSGKLVVTGQTATLDQKLLDIESISFADGSESEEAVLDVVLKGSPVSTLLKMSRKTVNDFIAAMTPKDKLKIANADRADAPPVAKTNRAAAKAGTGATVSSTLKALYETVSNLQKSGKLPKSTAE